MFRRLKRRGICPGSNPVGGPASCGLDDWANLILVLIFAARTLPVDRLWGIYSGLCVTQNQTKTGHGILACLLPHLVTPIVGQIYTYHFAFLKPPAASSAFHLASSFSRMQRKHCWRNWMHGPSGRHEQAFQRRFSAAIFSALSFAS